MDTQQTIVSRAFGKQSVQFDKNQLENPILVIMRNHVWDEALRFIKPGDHILELNAGTGLDAVFFAQHGCSVLATDIAEGMLQQINMKVEENNLKDKIQVKQMSFHELNKIQGEKFDYIFSNFGGLNCTDDLRSVFAQFPSLLKPNGHVTMAMVSPICPWELTYFFRGKWKMAFRRMKKKHVIAHLEGEYFSVEYYSPSQVIKAFPLGFSKVSLTGLASFLPPPYMENFPRKFPYIFKLLQKMDNVMRKIPPFTSWGDYFILTMNYKG